jgi:aminoglycoside 6'-N-acetyltransferase
MEGLLTFRRMVENDLALMHEWLQREHVRRWWSRRETYNEVVDHYLPAITGRKPTDLYVIELDDRPVGFIQTYLVSDYPDYYPAATARADEEGRVAGVDLFIAEEELTGRGFGTEVIRTFVRDVVFAAQRTIACIADAEVHNAASIRAFEKAGFRAVGEFVDPHDDAIHRLMRLDRTPS